MGAFSPRTCLLVALVLGCLLGLPGVAWAQNLYLEGHFGGSEATTKNSSEIQVITRIDEDENDRDRSIVGGGAMGFRFPLSWALDRPLPRWMPDAHFRVELEGAFGREYNFTTEGSLPDSDVRTEVKNWTLMPSFWVEIPFYRDWSIYGGAGLGPAFSKVSTKEPLFAEGDRTKTNFAWQGGAGLEYRFDDQVTMGFGYRYVDLGSVEVNVDEFRTNPPRDAGNVDVDVAAHEFMLKLRVNFYYF